jgi:hypothetical protein
MDRQTMNAILGTIADMGERGAPEGVMYAALMARCDLSSFQAALGAFERAGLITRSGHLARATQKLLDAVEKAKGAVPV